MVDTGISKPVRWWVYIIYFGSLVALGAFWNFEIFRSRFFFDFGVHERFARCFFSLPVFYIFLSLPVMTFLGSCKAGINPAKFLSVSSARAIAFFLLFPFLGMTILQGVQLNSFWYGSPWFSLSWGMTVFLIILLAVTALTIIFIIICLGADKSKIIIWGNTFLFLALLTWAYFMAASFCAWPFYIEIDSTIIPLP